jgi:hypothetical protein
VHRTSASTDVGVCVTHGHGRTAILSEERKEDKERRKERRIHFLQINSNNIDFIHQINNSRRLLLGLILQIKTKSNTCIQRREPKSRLFSSY